MFYVKNNVDTITADPALQRNIGADPDPGLGVVLYTIQAQYSLVFH